ncbi:hypothetical protein [Dysgonomonas sp. Marseille-P4361]|uniref:hypothetical protein n=1 Tax=Dysgonomonas sp. Marseille-P4361 TaxID=2161820 RepID=UPI003514BDFE
MKKLIFIGVILVGLFACQPSNKNEQGTQTVEKTKQEKKEVVLKDYGADPLVINIEDYTLENNTFRTAIWTGQNLQLTVMSIPVGGEVGL